MNVLVVQKHSQYGGLCLGGNGVPLEGFCEPHEFLFTGLIGGLFGGHALRHKVAAVLVNPALVLVVGHFLDQFHHVGGNTHGNHVFRGLLGRRCHQVLQNGQGLHLFGLSLVLEVVRHTLEKIDVGATSLVLLVFVDFGCNFVSVLIREHVDPL